MVVVFFVDIGFRVVGSGLIFGCIDGFCDGKIFWYLIEDINVELSSMRIFYILGWRSIKNRWKWRIVEVYMDKKC